MHLFVPGRICLFGEHSDWAGGYRSDHPEIEKGYAVLVGTNQGVYAEVKPHPSKLVYKAALNDGSRKDPWEIPMNPEMLLAAAQRGGFYSYIAGVAYQLLARVQVEGLEIDNYQTDLPIKKGLSSSAAVCVLVTRAFNRIYDLGLSTRDEMEIAYQGEITTPSRCGRLDQGCAYGNRPIEMVFDGDGLEVNELPVRNKLHYVIVDLNAEKDTREILARLNQCYPVPETDVHRNVQQYLGPINKRIVAQAVESLKQGDAEQLGTLMKEAQEQFDKHCGPACPEQLTAPVLHKLLNYGAIQQFIYGGKGVGSQGDGSAQLLAKDRDSQKKVIEIIERELNMPCMELVISPVSGLRKAVIPAAGFGTRLFPATKAVKKELFPVIDREGKAKPVLLAIIEEAVSAGIEEVGIIVQNNDIKTFEDIFRTPLETEFFNKLSEENKAYAHYLMGLGQRITFIPQDTQEGFGHAVYCAREWVGDEPFLLLLGDHLYRSEIDDTSCAQQMMEAYRTAGTNVIGLKIALGEHVHLYGCAKGKLNEENELITLTGFVEKPHLEYAQQHLRVDHLPDNMFLTTFGQYILNPVIFDYLEENISNNFRENGEFQLTTCLDRLCREKTTYGCVIKGSRFDMGYPDAYLNTLMEFKSQKPEP